MALLHLELGDPVAEQPADAVGPLEHHDVVTGARELLRRGQTGGARADHRRIVARHIGNRDGDNAGGNGVARQPPALDAREMFAHGVDLADMRAGAQQRPRHRLFVCKRNAVRRRDPVGRCAARHQHQHQIVGGSSIGEFERTLGRLQAGRIRHWMAGLDHGDDAGRPAIAMPRYRDAANAFGWQTHRIEIIILRGLGHRAGGFAGRQNNHMAARRRRQQARQERRRMRGFYRNAIQRCEKSAQVVFCLIHQCPHFRKPAYIDKSAGGLL